MRLWLYGSIASILVFINDKVIHLKFANYILIQINAYFFVFEFEYNFTGSKISGSKNCPIFLFFIIFHLEFLYLLLLLPLIHLHSFIPFLLQRIPLDIDTHIWGIPQPYSFWHSVRDLPLDVRQSWVLNFFSISGSVPNNYFNIRERWNLFGVCCLALRNILNSKIWPFMTSLR